jgi:hypothetical protein
LGHLHELKRLNVEDLTVDIYHNLLFYKGAAAYKLRDYKSSTLIFKYLSKNDPRNENYIDWLNHSRYGQKLWLVKIINIICGILAIIYLFTKEYIVIAEFKLSILGLAMLGLLSNWIYEYYIKRSFKNNTKHIN